MLVRSVRSVSAATADALVVGMFSGRRQAPGTAPVTRALGDWIDGALEAAGFDGSQSQTAVIPAGDAALPTRVVFVGLGDESDLEALRRAAARGRRAVESSDRIATTLHRIGLDGAVQAVVEGFGLADYRFDAYKSDRRDRPEATLELVGSAAGWKTEAAAGTAVAEAVALARDLVNEPAAAKGPLELADRALAAAREHGVDGEVWSGDRLVEERLDGTRAVGAGSHRPPCLLILRHRPATAARSLALVGKGIVFDSGGLDIKSAEYMEPMKTDMAGAAAVIGAMVAIARLGLEVDVTAYAPLAENMPGGGAQRPGDVIRYRNGRTIEVLNTDAEGRLVLADALCLAAEQSPDLVVDIATLTGACRVALGDKIAGVWGNDDEAVRAVTAAAEAAGERVWPMPLPDDYRTSIESPVADVKNTGGRYGGAITAALILSDFAGDRPWAHLDVAGPARSDSVEHYVPKGGTGFGVRTLIEVAAGMAG